MRSVPFIFLIMGAAAADAGECRYEARRDATVAASGAGALFVRGEAGALGVEGVPGLREVQVEGRACASSPELLERTQVRAERAGSQVRVLADVPDSMGWRSWAWLDLTLRVPEGLRVEIEDGSGPLDVKGVGALSIKDGSGEIDVEDVRGDLRLHDGSGAIRARKVAGSVTIEDDGSGEIELSDVTGSVVIEEDGSGGIDITGVTGDVRVRKAGSGGVQVRDVGGDLEVGNDRSGHVRHSNVRGQVNLPRRRR